VGTAGRPLNLGSRSTSYAAALVALAAACRGSDAPSLPDELPPPPEPVVSEVAPEPDPLYGPDGELLESDQRVAGLTLPRGLEEILREERRYVYRSPAPLAKVQRYFGPRLLTGQVDVLPSGGAAYRDAVPREARGGAVRLDVIIEPSTVARSRVEIIERPPPIVTPPSEEETLRRLRERLEQAD
jgi:hypothetical protein